MMVRREMRTWNEGFPSEQAACNQDGMLLLSQFALRKFPCPPSVLLHLLGRLMFPGSCVSWLLAGSANKRHWGWSEVGGRGRPGWSPPPLCLGQPLSLLPAPRFLLLLGDWPLHHQLMTGEAPLIHLWPASLSLAGFLAVPSLMQPIPWIKFSPLSIFRAHSTFLFGPTTGVK